jgi:hypothetical protein
VGYVEFTVSSWMTRFSSTVERSQLLDFWALGSLGAPEAAKILSGLEI